MIPSSKSDHQTRLLSVDLLQPNPFQPRNIIHEEDVEDLANSIKRYGILEPLIIAHTPAGYQIIAGERRWRAAQQAGLEEVPVVIRETTPRGMLEMALIENVQRVDLNAIERAKAFQQLARDFSFTVGEIAKAIGKSGSYVSNSLRLLNLPDAVKDGVVGGQITEGHARAIAGIEDAQLMVQLYKRILKENASVRKAEELARIYKEQFGPGMTIKKRTSTTTQVDDPAVQKFALKIKKLVQAKAAVKLHRSRSQTKIVISLKGDEKETQKDLEKILSLVSEKNA